MVHHKAESGDGRKCYLVYAPVAQLVEHVTFNHGVESSNLSGGTIYARVTEWHTCLTQNQDFVGSTPILSTRDL